MGVITVDWNRPEGVTIPYVNFGNANDPKSFTVLNIPRYGSSAVERKELATGANDPDFYIYNVQKSLFQLCTRALGLTKIEDVTDAPAYPTQPVHFNMLNRAYNNTMNFINTLGPSSANVTSLAGIRGEKLKKVGNVFVVGSGAFDAKEPKAIAAYKVMREMMNDPDILPYVLIANIHMSKTKI